MDDFILIAIKLLIGFLALIFVINVTGKGNLAPSSASDQIQNYVLGGIIGGVIYNKQIAILEYISILFIWCILVLSLKFIKTHNVKVKQILDGKALIIIDHGKINIENCKKAGLSAHDVAFKLRTNNIYSSKKVKRAVVEQNGQLIVVHAGEENPKFPLITDGQLHHDILEVISKDENWLNQELKKQKIASISEVFLGEYIDGELEITTASPDKILEVLNRNDYIFVSGGNTFYLLQELRRKGADALITEQIRAGKLYIGTSAGSVILCPDIEFVKEMDYSHAAPELQSFTGLNIVDFYILPHYLDFPFEETTQNVVKKYGKKLDLRPISNKQVITIAENRIEILENE